MLQLNNPLRLMTQFQIFLLTFGTRSRNHCLHHDRSLYFILSLGLDCLNVLFKLIHSLTTRTLNTDAFIRLSIVILISNMYPTSPFHSCPIFGFQYTLLVWSWFLWACIHSHTLGDPRSVHILQLDYFFVYSACMISLSRTLNNLVLHHDHFMSNLLSFLMKGYNYLREPFISIQVWWFLS